MTKTFLIAACAALGLAGSVSAQIARPQLVGVARAVSVAESQLDAKAFDAELDDDRGVLVYEISLVKDGRAIAADIDAVSGKLLRQHTPTAAQIRNRDELRAAQSAPRNLTQMIAMIETATKGRVSDIALERRNNRHYYDVELIGAQDRDILVDMRTGAISPVIDD